MNGRNTAEAARRVLYWPFTHPLASPLWLMVRLYLASVWFRFGWSKVQSGWLTANPVGDLLQAITDGHMPIPFPFYRSVARWLLDLGVDPWISSSLPILEIAVAVAFVSGILVVPAAVGAILLNANLILSGIASWSFDGRIIGLQVLLVLAWRVVDIVGIRALLVRVVRLPGESVRHPVHGPA